jgi:hypothetical protein
MDAILKCFKDPGWWLTAVVIAIVIAPVQKWVTDAFFTIAAKSSKKWADRKQRIAEERKREAMMLAMDSTLLILEGMKISVFFIVGLLWGLNANSMTTNTPFYWVHVVGMCVQALLQLLSVYIIFLAVRRFEPFFTAYHAYRILAAKRFDQILATQKEAMNKPQEPTAQIANKTADDK